MGIISFIAVVTSIISIAMVFQQKLRVGSKEKNVKGLEDIDVFDRAPEHTDLYPPKPKRTKVLVDDDLAIVDDYR